MPAKAGIHNHRPVFMDSGLFAGMTRKNMRAEDQGRRATLVLAATDD
jgi:hypothetical protein